MGQQFSKVGRIFFVFATLSFAILVTGRWVYGGWHDSLWVPLVFWLVFSVAAVFKERRVLKDFAGMRSTKYGMNMGALIVAAFVGLTCLNILAVRYDKRVDVTKERLNSLSPQSVEALKNLKTETELVLLTGRDAGGESAQRPIRDLVDMYQNESKMLRFSNYNVLRRPDLAQKFDYSFGPFAFFAVQGERKVKVDPPNEENLTRALMKLAREKKKTIYFLRGHGEVLLDEKTDRGMSILKDSLSVNYDIKSLALFESYNKIPADADIVAIIGPKQQLLPEEVIGLRDYMQKGGRLLLALDPGVRHNFAGFTKSLGVEFGNDFVLDLRSRQLRGSPSLVLGTNFSSTSEVTRAFKANGNEVALFELASSMKKAPEATETIKVDALVQTDETTANVPELKEKIEYHPNGPHVLAMAATGRFSNTEKEKSPEFNAVIFGDSDFLTNRLIHNNLNRDLIENAVAWLGADKDLITIRPKEPMGTRLTLMDSTLALLDLGLLGITAFLFASSIGIWWRRRLA